MNSRHQRPAVRGPVAPMHRGPQSLPAVMSPTFHHAPNAALLIDFDNVTMGIRSDLASELRSLLSSDIIKGKVAVQRAYADWRRYPQYIVPLAESSIDMIMAPAYGTSKKNATDIRLAVDAIELVFTRSEIGTYILLSGDSDFASLVTKLKEYGKYVIGVGIRESSSDLLVMNCDEYYSYNALAGLVRTSDEEPVARDPWELVSEAVQRMKRNGDVMRADRLKQVMQEIDSTFDEKNLGMAKFSRFVQEASQRGLLRLSKLENGQIEIDLPEAAPGAAPAPRRDEEPRAGAAAERPREERERTRGRRGRGRERGRERPRAAEAPAPETAGFAPPLEPPITAAAIPAPPPAPAPERTAAAPADMGGERLTRNEAFDLVRRSLEQLGIQADQTVRASELRRTARTLLGRDSESLSERNFLRILRDAHDANAVDLRKRGDDYEVSPAAEATPIDQQLAAAEPPRAASTGSAASSAAGAASLRRGLRGRGGGGRGGPARARPTELPPELLSIGVVERESPRAAPPLAHAGAPAPSIVPEMPVVEPPESAEADVKAAPARRGGRAAKGTRKTARKSGARAAAAAAAPEPAAEPAPSPEEAAAAPKRRGRAKKTAAPAGSKG